MSGAVSRLLGLIWLGFFSACSTYTSLEGTLQGGPSADAGSASGGSGGSESDGGGSGDATGATGGMAAAAGTSSAGTSASGASGAAGSGGSGGSASTVVEPTGLRLSTEATEVVREPDAGGTQYVERCPENQVLIGFHGTIDAPGGETYLRSAQGICGSLSISESQPWQISVTEAEPLATHDVAGAEAQTARCPVDQVMVGFAGRSGQWMDSVDVRCAPLTILGMSPSYLLVTGTASKAATIGGTTGGSPFDPLECPAGSLAVGQLIRTIYDGVVLGAFGVQCAAITLEVE